MRSMGGGWRHLDGGVRVEGGVWVDGGVWVQHLHQLGMCPIGGEQVHHEQALLPPLLLLPDQGDQRGGLCQGDPQPGGQHL